MLLAPRSRAATVALTICLVVLVGSSVVALSGGSVLILLAAAGTPAFLLLFSRYPLGPTMAFFLAFAAWSALVVFSLSRVIGVPPLILVVAVALVVGSVCALRLRVRGLRVEEGKGADIASVSIGGVVWGATIILAAFLPGTAISWAMYGDAANNVLFARGVIDSGGIAFGPDQNPVPLTAALIALFMVSTATPGAPSVGGEIIALTQMWSCGIVAACLLCGALSISMVRQRGALRYISAAIGSLLPLSWLMLAGSFELGFVNLHLTIAVAVACLVLTIRIGPGTTMRIVASTLLLTLAMALWTPVATIPLVALIIVIVTERRAILRLRGVRLALVIGGLTQSLLFFLLLPLPSLLSQGDALTVATGAVLRFPTATLLGLAILAVLIGLLHLRVVRNWDGVRVLSVVVLGGGSGLGFLLWLRRHEDTLWSYYQLKLLWLVIALLFISIVAVGFAVAAEVRRRPAARAAVVMLTVLLVLGIGERSGALEQDYKRNAPMQRDPLSRVMAGDFFVVGADDRVFDQVVDLTAREHPTILWGSGDPDESSIMFWILQMASTAAASELRTFAYYRDTSSIDDLCEISHLLGPDVEVLTRDPDLATEVALMCPGAADVHVLG